MTGPGPGKSDDSVKDQVLGRLGRLIKDSRNQQEQTVPKKIRVRFAPSPTGYLHLGTARTALFNWLYVRRMGGKFILRIEDTDKIRSKQEYIDEIINDLQWLGIDWDEGPFPQSERQDKYRKAAEKILSKGLAFREGNAIIYKVEKGRVIEISDIVHGNIEFNTDEIKDQVLIKSDGSPAYNFACVVDDDYMGITHIIRGDDHISNTPKQILFYEALGIVPPIFAHMPLMMGKDGSKLSKRHGGVAVFEYKNEGFLPEALSNYLLLLGWTPRQGKEVFTLKDIIRDFDIKDINDTQAKFDIDRLRWLNSEHIMRKSAEELYDILEGRLTEAGYLEDSVEKAYVLRVIQLYKTRFKTLNDFVVLTRPFFKDDFPMDEKAVKKHLDPHESKEVLKKFADRLKILDVFTAAGIEGVCRKLAEELNLKAAKLIHPTRVSISGMTAGAGLFEMMDVLGKDRVVSRMEKVC